MKSFRLYCEPSPSRPTQVASELSPDEQMRLQQAFRTVAATYRHHLRMASYAWFGFAGSMVGLVFFGGVLRVTFALWFLVSGLVSWMVAFGCEATAPGLLCPGCGNDMTYSFGRYCPECGADGLPRVPWLRCTKCTICGKSLRWRKGRRYKIRACTHCGLRWMKTDCEDEGTAVHVPWASEMVARSVRPPGNLMPVTLGRGSRKC